jgi:hypothetical protein
MKKDIFFRNGSIKYLSECDMDAFWYWFCATYSPFRTYMTSTYRTAVLSELQKRVEILK